MSLLISNKIYKKLEKIGFKGGNFDQAISWFKDNHLMYGYVHPVFNRGLGESKYFTTYGYTISGTGIKSSSTVFKNIENLEPRSYSEARDCLVEKLIKTLVCEE